MRPVAAALALVLALAAGACDEDRRFPTADDLDDVDLTVDHALVVDESGFEPAELTVREGDVIEVTNEGEKTHTLTAEAQDGEVAFDVTLEPGDVLTLVAPAPGELPYRDREVPDHAGVLVVRPR